MSGGYRIRKFSSESFQLDHPPPRSPPCLFRRRCSDISRPAGFITATAVQCRSIRRRLFRRRCSDTSRPAGVYSGDGCSVPLDPPGCCSDGGCSSAALSVGCCSATAVSVPLCLLVAVLRRLFRCRSTRPSLIPATLFCCRAVRRRLFGYFTVRRISAFSCSASEAGILPASTRVPIVKKAAGSVRGPLLSVIGSSMKLLASFLDVSVFLCIACAEWPSGA